jgi:precorrin-2/cobalt-factor-2 C20-methyltransferase
VKSGTVYGVGVGPGDPDLVTVKAVQVLSRARVVAYFSKRGNKSNALAAAERYLHPEAEQLPLIYPYTVELSARDPRYIAALRAFYAESSASIGARLLAGQDVAVLCEGDPLLYGSYLHLHALLMGEHRCTVIPGITSFAGCAASAGIPLVSTDRVFSILPGTLSEAELERRLRAPDAVAIIKLGRNFAKVKRVLERVGRAHEATFVEHGTTARERVLPLVEKTDEQAVYFSLILVPQLGVERPLEAERALDTAQLPVQLGTKAPCPLE